MTQARECLVGFSQERLDPLSKSITLALWTLALSTRSCACLPTSASFKALDLLAAVVAALLSSYPGRLDLPWESTTPALGSGSRSMRTRRRLRKAACILSQVPSSRQVLK